MRLLLKGRWRKSTRAGKESHCRVQIRNAASIVFTSGTAAFTGSMSRRQKGVRLRPVNQQIVWLRAEMRLRKSSFDTQNVGNSSQTVWGAAATPISVRNC